MGFDTSKNVGDWYGMYMTGVFLGTLIALCELIPPKRNLSGNGADSGMAFITIIVGLIQDPSVGAFFKQVACLTFRAEFRVRHTNFCRRSGDQMSQ